MLMAGRRFVRLDLILNFQDWDKNSSFYLDLTLTRFRGLVSKFKEKPIQKPWFKFILF